MADTSTERASRQRARLKDAGMVEIRLWVRPEHKERVRAYAKALDPTVVLSKAQEKVYKKVVAETKKFPHLYHFYMPYRSAAWSGTTAGDQQLIVRRWEQDLAEGRIKHAQRVVIEGQTRGPNTYRIK